jgi:hypothetical protein
MNSHYLVGCKRLYSARKLRMADTKTIGVNFHKLQNCFITGVLIWNEGTSPIDNTNTITLRSEFIVR